MAIKRRVRRRRAKHILSRAAINRNLIASKRKRIAAKRTILRGMVLKRKHATAKRIILASSSLRRRKLLSSLVGKFSVAAPHINERAFSNRPPALLAKKLAEAKALRIALCNPDAVVIGADTILLFGGEILGKPASPAQARIMLSSFSGRKITAITGIALACGKKLRSWHERADVKFINLREESINAYVAGGKWRGKAGGFNIAELPAKSWVHAIRGDSNTVVGLPLGRLKGVLENAQT